MIRFACPTCEKVYKARDELAGRELVCKKCGAAFLVPERPVREVHYGTMLPSEAPAQPLPEPKPDEPFGFDPPARPSSRRSRRRHEYQDEDQEPRSHKRRRGFRCMHCGSSDLPVTVKKISTGGWIVFVVILLVFFPLCWIGLLITDNYKVCYECRIRLGG